MKTILQTTKAGIFMALIFLAINGFSEGKMRIMDPSMNPAPLAAPVTTIGNNISCSGYTFVVPVTVTGFTNVGGISLKFAYDTTMVVYQSAVINPALSGLTPTYGVNLGSFSLSASGLTGVSLPDGSTLMSITFLARPTASGMTFFSWSQVLSDCEYAPPPPDPPYVTSPFANYFINGNCNILVSPVPTLAGPATICRDITGNIYTTEAGKTNYLWTVSAGGTVTAGGTATSNTVTVTWNAAGAQSVSVNYTDANGCAAPTATSYPVLVNDLPVPTITTPLATISTGIIVQGFKTEAGMTGYVWTVSAAGAILNGQGTDSLTVTWTNPSGNQSVSVTYINGNGCAAATPTSYIVLYYPYAGPINPWSIKQFVEPLPHFAAGLRVNAKAGGNLLVQAVPVQQIAVSRGTVLANGDTVGGINPNAGKGNYQAYRISTNGGATFGPAMWPAQTIECHQGNQVVVQYENKLIGNTYADFNILVDQTLMPTGYNLNGNIYTDPYSGPIPMVTHLHGGEIPSNSDGGPTAWFMPNYSLLGPGFSHDASSLCTYPNQQEGTTLWYHPHDQGLTRINVYCGLAGFYFLRGNNEDALHLPGWSGDDFVREVTPSGKYPTFNGTNTYLPEIEIAVQDRMFNVNGALYWPVAPTNPDTHPFWTPEFFGDVMTVNGKTWPYLSVAPRKYAFRFLDGCNARFLNMWLTSDTALQPVDGPLITRISTEGGFMEHPSTSPYLFLAPAERPTIIIDFSGYAPGTVFYLVNDALAPYPTGDPVIHGLTDRIMQFVVNGEMVDNTVPTNPGIDKSDPITPATNLRPLDPLVKLTDFNGNIAPGVVPVKTRQLLLNEISGAGGPLIVSVNNSRFETLPANGVEPAQFGDPTEIPTEGTTEIWQIINTTADAHPMHPHLVQWQLVSRRPFNVDLYLAAYAAAWAPRGLPNYPSFAAYPGGSGSPFPYDSVNTDGAIGGNPPVSGFYTGPAIAPTPEERGWKDSFKAFPGEVSTYICRVAPTDKPIAAPVDQLVYSFDPSTGPGYVWHCHIIDHEDMDMMRPNPISASPVRYPLISSQPAPFTACVGDVATFTVAASSVNPITYRWQVSTNGGTTWDTIANGGPYTNAGTNTLSVSATLGLNAYQFRCRLTNIDGVTYSSAVALTVNNCALTGSLLYFNAGLTPLTGMTVTVNSTPPVTSAAVAGDGSFNIPNVPSGTYNITINPNGKAVGGINSTDAGLVNYWGVNGGLIEEVKFLAGDVMNDWWINAADAQRIQQHFVFGTSFPRGPWVFWPAGNFVSSNMVPNPIPSSYTVTVDHAGVANFNLYGMATGDFNGNFVPSALKGGNANVQLTYQSTIKVEADQYFDLPLRAVSQMSVGAASLILNFPSDLVQVVDVVMNGSTEPLSFNTRGNELRIGWNSSTPVYTFPGGDVIILKLRTTPAFAEGKSIKFELVNDELNELADASMKAIPDATLAMDMVEFSTTGISELPNNGLSMSSYPNPFSTYSTITYTLPFDGKVSLTVTNILGVQVSSLVSETQTAGRYELKIDARTLANGIYTAKLRLNGADKELVTVIKIVADK